MFRKIMNHHDIDAEFLEVPLSFFDRMTDEEQAVCVPWTLKEAGSAFRTFATPSTFSSNVPC
jgi:hypothetical protein